MRKLWLDTETFSPVDLERGVDVYAAHPDADINLAAWAIDDEPVWCWQKGDPPLVIPDDVIIHAFNARFERTLLRQVWGIDLPPERFYCVQAQAYAHGFPGSLEDLGRFVGLAPDQAKLAKGKELIRLFGSPHKGVRNTAESHPLEWALYRDYCIRDVESMRLAHQRMPQVNYSGAEYALWCLDQRINDRGVEIDLDLARACVAACAEEAERLNAKVAELTLGAITKGTQRARLLDWLQGMGVPIDDMQAGTLVRAASDAELCAEARVLIETRQATSKTSTAKYGVVLKAAPEGRLRGSLQFCGARRTRRWAGRIFQPHNLPRTPSDFDARAQTDAIDAFKLECAPFLYRSVHETAAHCLRGLIIAAPGCELLVADWSAIEGRGLAWLADEQWKLDAYARGEDMYKLTYARAFGVDVNDVDEKMRQEGKCLDLASGYQGAVGALLRFCQAYRMNPVALAQGAWRASSRDVRDRALDLWSWAQERGHTLHLDRATYVGLQCAKIAWRDASPKIVQFWKDMNTAALRACATPNTWQHVGALGFAVKAGFLVMRLPSGGMLFYLDPQVRTTHKIVNDDGDIVLEEGRPYVSFLDTRGGRVALYGGLLVENSCQATCRDILAGALPRIEAAGLPIVMHVHDDVAVEVPTGTRSCDELIALMCQTPAWAAGLPLAAKGYTGARYRK